MDDPNEFDAHVLRRSIAGMVAAGYTRDQIREAMRGKRFDNAVIELELAEHFGTDTPPPLFGSQRGRHRRNGEL